MTQQEKFLTVYKEYETLVRAAGKYPKDIEIEAEEIEANRLCICRQFRNYLSHVSDPGFLVPTDKMLKFLQGRVEVLKSQNDTAKKHTKKPDACILQVSDRVLDAIEMFAKMKRDTLLVRGGITWFQISVYDVLGLKTTEKLEKVKKKIIVPNHCAPLDSYASLDFSKPVLCTDNGTKDGKILGQVFDN